MRNELSVHDGLVLRGSRIVIPGSMRSEMLERIHDGHQGLTKFRMRADTSVWWPGITSQITHKVENCMYGSIGEHRTRSLSCQEEKVVSDYGPQFSSDAFSDFACEMDFNGQENQDDFTYPG